MANNFGSSKDQLLGLGKLDCIFEQHGHDDLIPKALWVFLTKMACNQPLLRGW
jgi:hypothetical protein